MTGPISDIELIHLHKTYGEKTAVRDLNLKIRPGLIHCFLGPNGAGKTTTIKTIMGLKNPTRGDILIKGVSHYSKEIHEIRRSIGYLPEETILYEHLTGREFLHFIGELYGMQRHLQDRIQAILEHFDLAADADKLIETYSLGMKKKTAIMATLLHEPDILIYDEPTGGLDAIAARKVKAILQDFRIRGKVVFFTTHIMELAERITERLAIIDKGNLCFDGTLAELRQDHGVRPDEPLEDIFVRLITTKPETDRASGILRFGQGKINT